MQQNGTNFILAFAQNILSNESYTKTIPQNLKYAESCMTKTIFHDQCQSGNLYILRRELGQLFAFVLSIGPIRQKNFIANTQIHQNHRFRARILVKVLGEWPFFGG